MMTGPTSELMSTKGVLDRVGIEVVAEGLREGSELLAVSFDAWMRGLASRSRDSDERRCGFGSGW